MQQPREICSDMRHLCSWELISELSNSSCELQTPKTHVVNPRGILLCPMGSFVVVVFLHCGQFRLGHLIVLLSDVRPETNHKNKALDQ